MTLGQKKNLISKSSLKTDESPSQQQAALLVKLEKENKPVIRKTVRGKAALLLDSSSESESDQETVGIYGCIIKNTKNELQVTKNKFIRAENKIIKANHNEVKPPTVNTEDEDTRSDDSSSSADKPSTANSDSNYHSNALKLSLKKSVSVSSSSPSPPPPPKPQVSIKSKRKSTTVVEKRLREWDVLKSKTLSAQNAAAATNECDQSLVDEEDTNNNFILRIFTKMGIQRIETKKDQQFQSIYSKVSSLENIEIQNLILIHNEKRIENTDTPISLNILFTDIIYCQYIKAKKHERIELAGKGSEEDGEDGKEQTLPDNMQSVILQTIDGRKSRLKFFIAKDEPLNNLLALYCKYRDLGDKNKFILEFDGDVVSRTDTSIGLDLDGGEIFDVKKSKKPTMQHVQDNKKNYEFDPDVLSC